MSLATKWMCLGIAPHTDPCGAHGTTDKGAAKHTETTHHATGAVTTCWVTQTNHGFFGTHAPLCGKPVHTGALCAKHAADARRLGGTP